MPEHLDPAQGARAQPAHHGDLHRGRRRPRDLHPEHAGRRTCGHRLVRRSRRPVHDGYGRDLADLEVWGGGLHRPRLHRRQPLPHGNLPQIRLEPVLKDHAEKLNPGGVRFHHELIDLDQDADGVTPPSATSAPTSTYQVRCAVPDRLPTAGAPSASSSAIEMNGPAQHHDDGHHPHDRRPVAWRQRRRRPDPLVWSTPTSAAPAAACSSRMGPDHWGTASEEWVFHMQPTRPTTPTPTPGEGRSHACGTRSGCPISPADIHTCQPLGRWKASSPTSSAQAGSSSLGDAAHRHPPTGGLGPELGHPRRIQPVLEARGRAARTRPATALLDTYEAERQPVDPANIAQRRCPAR